MMSCLFRNSFGFRVILRFAVIMLGALLCQLAYAQEGVPPVEGEEPEPEPKEMTAAEKAALEKIRAEALAEILGDNGGTNHSQAQVENFTKWIPRTYARLKEREAVHIVAIGDSVTRYMSYDENLNSSHHAFHGVFARRLAGEFQYTGGVRDISPAKGLPEKHEPLLGKELTLENLGMNGRVSLHALSRLTTDALVNEPDLVLINFGINDAFQNLGIATFTEALDRAVIAVQASGADVMLIGPSTVLNGDTIDGVAITLPYSGAMKEVAARHGVFFYDLAKVTTSAPGTRSGTKPAAALEDIYRSFTSYFDHGSENEDRIHPCPSAHQKMGVAILKALRDGEEAPYRVNGLFSLVGAGKGVLEFKVKNLTDEPVSGFAHVLPTAGMQPEEADIEFQLAAGKGKVFKVPFEPLAGSGYDLPADAARLFASVLISDPKRTTSVVFPAQLAPLSVVWDTGLTDRSSSKFEVKCDVVSTGAVAASGTYEASWNGGTSRGNYSVAPGGTQTLTLSFDAPAGGDFRVIDDLSLSLNYSGKVLQFKRKLEATRNIALGEEVEMMVNSGAQRGQVQFSARATAKDLSLNFDVAGIPLEGDATTSALVLEFQIDGRAFGKRRKFGFVDSVKIRFDATGNTERLSALRPAVFGDFYDRALDNTQLKVASSRLANGRTRYSVSIPRSYLYLHEFAIGDEKSILGINADLSFAKLGDPTDPYPQDRHFTLVRSGLSPNLAESLTALELLGRSTGRWSFRVR